MPIIVAYVISIFSYLFGAGIMAWIKRDRFEKVNLNRFALDVTATEGKSFSINNAQVKEVMRIIFVKLAHMPISQVNYILKKYKGDAGINWAKVVKEASSLEGKRYASARLREQNEQE